MAGSILKLMQDATYGVKIQAPDSGLTADVNLRIIRVTLTYDTEFWPPWAVSGTTEGKSYLVIGASYGTWATPITAISLCPSLVILRHYADSVQLQIDSQAQIKQGGSWTNLASGSLVTGDIVYLYAIES